MTNLEQRFANAQYELENQSRLDHDEISMVAVKISSSNLSTEGKVNAIEGLLKVQQFWSRKCDESGEGFDDGWLMGDGIYLKYEKDVDGYLIEWATLDGYEYDDIEELKEYYHDNESYYYTEWDFSYELMNETFYLELSTGDVVSWDEYLDEHIGIPYNTLYPELLENVGKYLIITDDLGTLSDHQNYDGSPIKIDSVSPDGYYLCGGYVVDGGECEIVD